MASFISESKPQNQTPLDTSSSKTLRVYPPDFMKFVIGEPQRAEAHSQRVPAFPNVLGDHAVGGRVDLRKWFADGSHPYGALSHGNIAACAGHANFNGCRYLVGGRVDARYTAVALIEGPNAAQTSGQEARRGPYGNLRDHFFALRIHAGKQIALGAGDPNRAGVERGGKRTRRYGNLRKHLISR